MPTLLEVLSFKTYSEEYKKIESGIPNQFPEGFLSRTRPVRGDSAKLLLRNGQRRTMGIVNYGSPARKIAQRTTEFLDRKLLHFYERMDFDPQLMLALRDGVRVGSLGDAAVDEFNYQVAEFKQKQVNTRVACVGTLFSLTSAGTINFDADGDLLPDTTGATLTLTTSMVPANNRDQANGIIGASWATDGTDILGDIIALKDQQLRNCGKTLKYAFYGTNIPEYMASNTILLNFMARNPSVNPELLSRGEVPADLLGLKWVPFHQAFYEDADGTNQTFFGGDHIALVPDPADFFTMLEGSYAVPTSTGLTGDASGPLDGTVEQYGSFSFAHRDFEAGVSSLQLYMGDTFLPESHANIGAACPYFLLDVTP